MTTVLSLLGACAIGLAVGRFFDGNVVLGAVLLAIGAMLMRGPMWLESRRTAGSDDAAV